MTKKLVSLELIKHDWGYGLAIVWDGEIDDASVSRTGGRSQSFYNAENLDAVAKSLRSLADSLAGGVVEPPASRSVQRRVAAMKGEPAPDFSVCDCHGHPTKCGCAENRSPSQE